MAMRTIILFSFTKKEMRVVINSTHLVGAPSIFIEELGLDATEQPAWQNVTTTWGHRDKLPKIIALAMSLALRDAVAQPRLPHEIRVGDITPEWGGR